MQNVTAPSEMSASVEFIIARQRLRWLRWCWMIGGLAIYAIWDAFDQIVLTRYNPILGGFFIDWGITALLGIILTLLISRWEDHQLMELAEQTMRRERAEQARQQLEAVQATARAVAHNLNQPLAVIRGYAELLRDTPLNERSDDDLGNILIATDRAAAIVRQLVNLTLYQTTPYAGGPPMLRLE